MRMVNIMKMENKEEIKDHRIRLLVTSKKVVKNLRFINYKYKTLRLLFVEYFHYLKES